MIKIANSLQVLKRNGGDDETRTGDLCRDNQDTRKPYKTPHFVGWVVG
jgi:hypothetical protein